MSDVEGNVAEDDDGDHAHLADIFQTAYSTNIGMQYLKLEQAYERILVKI
ncbi:MAG: hypothetical protein ACKPGT_09050 [Microcystis sp.]